MVKMEITNFIKKIFDKDITEEVHDAFTRYSLGEFVKEPFLVTLSKKDAKVQTGFEYLNFLHRFLANSIEGEVELSGTIESVRDLGPKLKELGLEFEEKRRFGNSGNKFIIKKSVVDSSVYKKLVEELFGEYLLFNVKAQKGSLKVKKQTTPKLGSPTEKFVTVKIDKSLLADFKDDYLFDVDDDFKKLSIEQTYHIEDIVLDEDLLSKDAAAARKKALRKGEISRKVVVDDKVVKDYKIKFKV